MNIESLVHKIELFEKLVVSSGFLINLQDYSNAIQQEHNKNLAFMRDRSSEILKSFEIFRSYSLENEMEKIIRDGKSFFKTEAENKLIELNQNNEIDANEYFQQLNSIFNDLISKVNQNKKEANSVKAVFVKYTDEENDLDTDENQALVSLIFKDLKSISTLKEFSKVLHRWDRTLNILYQLLKSSSPDEVKLVEIQNGSIDVIFNIDIEIAIDFSELVKLGMITLGAYLTYKSDAAQNYASTFFGNEQLIKLEKEKEDLMLSNIHLSIKNKLLEKHKEKISLDKNIDKTSIDKKIEEVSKAISDHIVKGNEVKLLTIHSNEEDDEEKDGEEEEIQNIADELIQSSAEAKIYYEKISDVDKRQLIEYYEIKDNDK